jgi:two-component system, OmpR family, sensor histidine kinase CiaH
MFESARLKLTAWYLLIIMLISSFFSMAFYRAATDEITHLIERIQHEEEKIREEFPGFSRPRIVAPFSLEELESAKKRIAFNLILLNGFIFIIAGGSGYFLAGRTLRPIRQMVDEQKQFISNASHELRTPIATMRAEMEASLLEKNINDKQARELIQSNLEELSTLQNLTNNLLRLAQVHSSKSEKHSEVIALDTIIMQAKKKVEYLAKQKSITINDQIGKYTVIGDQQSFIEVFVILLDNAIKYSSEKTEVHISAKKKSGYVQVYVADEGIGISKRDLPHIFERFYRADKSRNKEGYGLGLSIAKKIIETYNGTITVTSSEKKGTTFTVSLPLKSSSRN